jgi:hypothetical protein
LKVISWPIAADRPKTAPPVSCVSMMPGSIAVPDVGGDPHLLDLDAVRRVGDLHDLADPTAERQREGKALRLAGGQFLAPVRHFGDLVRRPPPLPENRPSACGASQPDRTLPRCAISSMKLSWKKPFTELPTERQKLTGIGHGAGAEIADTR